MKFIFTVLAVLVVSIADTSAAEMTGRVVAIADGDTLTLLVDGREQVKIRLAEIDTPAKGQPTVIRHGRPSPLSPLRMMPA